MKCKLGDLCDNNGMQSGSSSMVDVWMIDSVLLHESKHLKCDFETFGPLENNLDG